MSPFLAAQRVPDCPPVELQLHAYAVALFHVAVQVHNCHRSGIQTGRADAPGQMVAKEQIDAAAHCRLGLNHCPLG